MYYDLKLNSIPIEVYSQDSVKAELTMKVLQQLSTYWRKIIYRDKGEEGDRLLRKRN